MAEEPEREFVLATISNGQMGSLHPVRVNVRVKVESAG